MLKKLFTSNTRVKLLTLFLLDPEKEYFIRELTRRLDEQINSIRRELDNLKKIGLLKSRTKDRKKYYVVNKNFIAFNELKSIIVKALSSREHVAGRITKMGKVEFLVLSGVFVDKSSAVDLLLVGDVNREQLETYLNKECETRRPVKFSVLSKDDFLYRLKCKDKFLHDIINDAENIIAVDRIRK
ncbi:MAG: hypothetical protein ABH856_00495 [Patescibacteria group bacterium]